MNTFRISILIVIILVAGMAACSRPPDSLAVVNSWAEALNKGDVNAALSYLADDAVVTISPPPPVGNGVFSGREQVRGWYDLLVGAHGISQMKDCKVQGKQVICKDIYTDDDFKAMGVDFIEGEWIGTMEDGKIQSYTITMSPESLSKLPPAP